MENTNKKETKEEVKGETKEEVNGEVKEEVNGEVKEETAGTIVAKKLVTRTINNSSDKLVIKNTSGKEVPVADYFYKNVIPSGFEGTCGRPVDRPDLLTVFNKVFKPEDNILFYKQLDKEVYLVIIPIKYSVSVGDFNDSIDGDFQKHAISFLGEGSVNLDTLKQKLERITKFVKYSDR